MNYQLVGCFPLGASPGGSGSESGRVGMPSAAVPNNHVGISVIDAVNRERVNSILFEVGYEF